MKAASLFRSVAVTLTIVAAVLAAPAAFAADQTACIKKEQAKGTSACIAKAKCSGVTSRKEQARLCN